MAVELSTLGSVIKTAYEGEADTNAFTDADHDKLDGIEDAATADMTGAEIKTAYEAEADTNAFTDNEKTKLSGIEALADVTDATNVAAAGAVMTTGSQLISAQANNDLSTNPKFWLGSQAEYDALTPTAGELYFILAP